MDYQIPKKYQMQNNAKNVKCKISSAKKYQKTKETQDLFSAKVMTLA